MDLSDGLWLVALFGSVGSGWWVLSPLFVSKPSQAVVGGGDEGGDAERGSAELQGKDVCEHICLQYLQYEKAYKRGDMEEEAWRLLSRQLEDRYVEESVGRKELGEELGLEWEEEKIRPPRDGLESKT